MSMMRLVQAVLCRHHLMVHARKRKLERLRSWISSWATLFVCLALVMQKGSRWMTWVADLWRLCYAQVCGAIAKQKRVTVVEGMLDMPGNSFAETGASPTTQHGPHQSTS